MIDVLRPQGTLDIGDSDGPVGPAPELVAEVAFGEWTSQGVLRHSSYIGLRSDKGPHDVVRET